MTNTNKIEVDKNFLYKLVFIISYFVILIGSENIYRDYLFIQSVELQIALSNNNDKNLKETVLYNFFHFITQLGKMPFFLAIFVFIFLFFPLNRPYLYLSNLFHSYYWVNLLKIIYSNPRPSWTNKQIESGCHGGFGNPSGHAFCSTSVFLTLALITTQYKYFNDKLFLKILIYFFYLSLIILIIVSRFILGAHSINQLLYGSLLGFGCYFIHCHLFRLNKIHPVSFFKLFREKAIYILFIIKYILMLTVLLIVYFATKSKVKKITDDYFNIIKDDKCQNKQLFRLFAEDGLFNCLAIVSLLGMHLGLMYTSNFLFKQKSSYRGKEKDIYNWFYDEKRIITLVFKFILLVLGGLPLVLYFLVPGSSELIIIYIFKVGIPFFLATFLIFGPFSRIFFEKRWARQRIYLENDNSSVEEKVKIESRIVK